MQIYEETNTTRVAAGQLLLVEGGTWEYALVAECAEYVYLVDPLDGEVVYRDLHEVDRAADGSFLIEDLLTLVDGATSLTVQRGDFRMTL